MKKDEFFATPLVKTLTDRIDRRGALKRILFGAGAATITPFLGGVPGVQAASGGGLENVRVLDLTGSALQQVVKQFQALPEYRGATALLQQKGIDASTGVKSGVQFFVRSGTALVTHTVLTVTYTSAQTPAVLSYHQQPDKTEVGVVIKNAANSGQTVYQMKGATAQFAGTLEAQGTTMTVRAEGRAPVSVEMSQQAAPGIITPQASSTCNLCNSLCGLVSTLCGLGSIWGIAACVGACVGFPACDVLCSILFLIVCQGASTSCSNVCSSQGYC